MLSPPFLRQLLTYDPDTGKLFWKERKPEMFKREADCRTFNTRFAGKEAFTAINPNGYHQGHIFNKIHYAHRVIWAIVYGDWPPKGFEIDHINRNPSDNRLENLRIVTSSQNGLNRGIVSKGTSSFRGITFNKESKRWLAQLSHLGKNYFGGRYTSAEEAARAYDVLARKLHGEFANLNFPERRTS